MPRITKAEAGIEFDRLTDRPRKTVERLRGGYRPPAPEALVWPAPKQIAKLADLERWEAEQASNTAA